MKTAKLDITYGSQWQQRPGPQIIDSLRHSYCLTEFLLRVGSVPDHGRAAEHAPADGGDWGADGGDRDGGSLHLTDCCRDSAASLVLVSAPSGELLPDDAVLVGPAAESSGHPLHPAAGVAAVDGRAGEAASGAATAERPWDRSGTGADYTADEAGGLTGPMRASWPSPSSRSPQDAAMRSLPALAGTDATTDGGDDAEDDAVASTREWLRQLSGDVPDPPVESSRAAGEEQAGGHPAPERTSLWPCASGAGIAVCDGQLAGRTQRAHVEQADAADAPQCALSTPAEAMLESWPAPAGSSAAVSVLHSVQPSDRGSAFDTAGEQGAAPQGAAAEATLLGAGHHTKAVSGEDAAVIVLDGCDGASTEETAGAVTASAREATAAQVQGPASAGSHRLASKARWHTLLPQSWLG